MVTRPNIRGFTLVELLIVIVVIAILATISIGVFIGVQQRARDTQRASDISAVAKALELYYVDNGNYPSGANGSTAITSSSAWSTTADASWAALMNVLKPYMGSSVIDPIHTPGADLRSTAGYDYQYYANASPYCGSTVNLQTYIIVYRFEAVAQKDTLLGTCASNPLLYTNNVSNYRVTK